jgi:hypothetical protein
MLPMTSHDVMVISKVLIVKTETYIVAAYNNEGRELARWDVVATDPAEACLLAERHVADRTFTSPDAVDEYQAIARRIRDVEALAEGYEQRAPVDVCTTCGVEGHHYYYHRDEPQSEAQCLPCVLAGFAHGRLHMPEAFEEDLLPVCGYCVTTGHRASDCPERPAEQPTPDAIADKFLALLRDELGDARFALVCERNLAEANVGICHSHDFCDANMIMNAAFEAFDLLASDDDETPMSDKHVALWNDGWERATNRTKDIALAAQGRA